jgi:hypothetical protein
MSINDGLTANKAAGLGNRDGIDDGSHGTGGNGTSLVSGPRVGHPS